jgi:hypothetical protein
MNCPKCNTPAADGASHCKRCGNPLTAKAAAAASSVPDEIDLMPLEESKAPTFSPYEPPPELGGPPAAAPAPGTKVRPKPDGPPPPGRFSRQDEEADKSGKTTLLIGGVVLALLVGFIGWRIIRPKHEIKSGKGKYESSATLQPNQVQIQDLEVVGSVTYKLDVNAMDSDIGYGVFKRSPKDPRSLAAVKKLPEGFDTASKGDPATKTGELNEGTWSWILINEGKKPARVKFKFVAE